MSRFKLLFVIFFAVFGVMLSSCRAGENTVGLMTPGTSCGKSIVFDSEIKFMFPNIGPLSIGARGTGIEIEAGVPGIEVEEYIGAPPPFEGFTCLTLKIINQDQANEVKQVAIYFQDGYELRIKIYSEASSEYVFSSGRMAVSSGAEKPDYIEYNYMTSTLTIDATERQVEYFVAKVEGTPTVDDIWFCSRQLEDGSRGFLYFSDIFNAAFHDLTNEVRENFLSLGPRLGTLLFWTSFLLIIGVSLGWGWLFMRKEKWLMGLMLCVIPILTTIIYMRVLFYDPNCPYG